MELTRKAGNTKKVSSQYLQISSTQKIVCLGLKTKLTAPEGYIVLMNPEEGLGFIPTVVQS